MGENWFALRVKARHEKSASEFAMAANLQAFVPVIKDLRRWTQRWKEIEAPLFPGYVFCRFGRTDFARVMRIPGVIDVVRFGKTLAPIEEVEIAALQRLAEKDMPVEPCRYLPTGQNISITSGPLQGVSGIVLEDAGSTHLVLSVTILQRSVRVTLDRDSIVALPCSPPVMAARQVDQLAG